MANGNRITVEGLVESLNNMFDGESEASLPQFVAVLNGNAIVCEGQDELDKVVGGAHRAEKDVQVYALTGEVKYVAPVYEITPVTGNDAVDAALNS